MIMMVALPRAQEINRFRSQILSLMGLSFDEPKLAMLAEVLHHRTQVTGFGLVAYLDWLATRPHEEIRLLARELTVTETYFLRNVDQFHALSEVALVERIAACQGKRTINLLSAGCASGEEPYSLAITLRERFPHLADKFTITAFDLNPAMLTKAERGVYSIWSLRDLSEEMKQRWFREENGSYILDESIRKSVNFQSRNLTEDDPDFWLSERFDIIFCRNIMMYFRTDYIQAAVDRLAKSLVPGGYLFLGHAETLRGISNDFHLCHSHQTFYYQRKEHITSDCVLPYSHSGTPVHVQSGGLGALKGIDTSWIDAIGRASARISALNAHRDFSGEAVATDRLSSVTQRDDGASDPSSLNQMTDLTAVQSIDSDALLLKAVSLCHRGVCAEAEAVCKELLVFDEFNAGAHYVLALCKEGSGEIDVAAEHDKTAAYLDHQFAMPVLHLGLLLRRKGDHAGAQRYLKQALVLLQQEESSRILLFGGGFKREALITLCRAELAALESVNEYRRIAI